MMGRSWGFNDGFLWSTERHNERAGKIHHAIFMGKTHYFDWAIFNSELLKYQRVCGLYLSKHH